MTKLILGEKAFFRTANNKLSGFLDSNGFLWRFCAIFIVSTLSTSSYADEGHGHNQDQVTVQEKINQEKCPVMTENDIDPSIFTEYQGEKVYFCCTFCKAAFEREPEKYLANLPQFAKVEQSHGPEPVVQDEHNAEHDHATDHDSEVHGINRAIRFVGKFHPVAVHIPIGLVLAAALAEILFLLTKRSYLAEAGRYCIIVGALGAVLSALLGWATAEFAGYSGEMARILTIHRWLGTSTTGLILTTAVLSILSRRNQHLQWIYRTLLFLAMAMVGATGHYGGTLIYGLGHYSW